MSSTNDWRIKHGHALEGRRSLTYSSWDGMLGRCYRRGNASYASYGGRGITVTKRWHKFENFLADMGERPSRAHQLERKRNSLGYSKTNCVWATRSRQARNRSSSLHLTLDGHTKVAADWAEELGWPVTMIWKRKERGWSDRKTLTTPRRAYPISLRGKSVQHQQE